MTRSTSESPRVRAYRELLGVPPVFTSDDLKKAYHRLAFLYHPDRNSEASAAADFQSVREAFEVLSDADRVRTLNVDHAQDRLMSVVVQGLNLTIGSFFGHREYKPMGLIARARRLGVEKTGENDLVASARVKRERHRSILDDPAFDAIEVVYAGHFSIGDEERLRTSFQPARVRQLPWVILNNQGVAHILDGDFAAALECFAALDERIPNNIIFLYRRGLCHVVLGLTTTRRSFLGGVTADRAEIERGLKFLRRAVRLGETRTVGKQKCLIIRKVIADVLDHLGSHRCARSAWREVLNLSPRSGEARTRSKRRLLPFG